MVDFFDEHDTLPPLKKEMTPFEKKRQAAKTYDELVQLGVEENMIFPEAWAERVLDARRNDY